MRRILLFSLLSLCVGTSLGQVDIIRRIPVPTGAVIDTFGYTSDAGFSEDGTDNCEIGYLYQFTGTTGSFLVGGGWAGRNSSGSSTSRVYLAIYSNSSGTPGSLLDSIGTECNLTSSVTFYEMSGTGLGYSLTNGTSYWIMASSELGSGWRNQTKFTGTNDWSWDCGRTAPGSGYSEDGSGQDIGRFYLLVQRP
jgi:hypothetical protein